MPTTPEVTSTKTLFSKTCAVTVNVQAAPETIWNLLTDAAAIPKWNSTVISVDGVIAPNQTIKLVSTLDPNRTFSLNISTFEPTRRLVWEDGFAPMFKGVRTYTLTPKGDTSTEFKMEEVFSGMMLPMIGGSLPDFEPNFKQFAADLKYAAEAQTT